MLGFNALKSNTAVISDYIDVVQEKKNDTIASAIANYRASKERASATAIGATFGVAQSALFAGAYAGAKAFPTLQKMPLVKWAVKKVDEWIAIAQKNNPTASKWHNIKSGVLAKSLYLVASSALTGFLFDWYKNHLDTKLNGKFSNVKQGQLDDSWALSGLKSLSQSSHGKKAIRNAMKPIDNGVIIKFKGIDKEYTVTKREIHQASRDYLTVFDENGKVKGYKKDFSSGDGDVLAFEIALRKYHNDLRLGKIKANADLPQCANQFSSNDRLSETEVSQLYFLLTGNAPDEINNNIFDSEQKTKLDNFLKSFADGTDKKPSAFTFKKDAVDLPLMKNRVKQAIKASPDKTYAIKSVNEKYVTVIDPRNTACEMQIAIEDFKQNFDKIYSANI